MALGKGRWREDRYGPEAMMRGMRVVPCPLGAWEQSGRVYAEHGDPSGLLLPLPVAWRLQS